MDGFYSRLKKKIGRSVRTADQRKLIYLLSFIIGILCSLAAVSLKNIVHFMHEIVTEGLRKDTGSILYLLLPMAGMFLTVLFVKYGIRDDIGHGVSRILYSISKRKSFLRPHNSYSSIIASSLTIGFGGSVGAEAPIVLTGASIGSNIGRLLRMNYRNITLLVGCGAAGAVSGIFKAPIAGIVFTLEILMLDLTIASIVPLMIASVTAAAVSYFFMGEQVLFTFSLLKTFRLVMIPWYILLGALSGLISVYFSLATIKLESLYEKISNQWVRLLSGGLVLGVLILLFPPFFGEGYSTILSLLEGNTEAVLETSFFSGNTDNFLILGLFLAGLVVFKVVASSSTNGAGGVGGIFAPSLFIGGVNGYLFARVVNQFAGVDMPTSNFALAGMAGIMSGVMHAPLTAIFLIAEITGGYGLLIPLIITSTVAFITVMGFEKHSIYHKQLARKGELITHDKDKAVLTLMDWTTEIETDLVTVHPDDTLGVLVKKISVSKRNIFPVVDEYNILEGVVLLDDVREIMFKPELYETVYVRQLMSMPPSYVDRKEKMDSVMETFHKTGAWNLPVLKDGYYAGFISKSRIYTAYRDLLVQFSEE